MLFRSHAEAMFELASNYYKGLGVIFDLDKALYWYENAAKAGNVNAMYNAALFYDGVAGISYENPNMAGYWFNEAAKKGVKDARQKLANYKYSSFTSKWKK